MGATVTAYRSRFEHGRRQLSPAESAGTDDLGQYRILNLPPGRYYVRAEAKGGTLSPANGSRELLIPSLYPDGQEVALARPLDIEAGSPVLGVDLTLARSTGVEVKGRAFAPAGTVLGILTLTRGTASPEALGLQFEARADQTGRFVFPLVPPGSYTLTAAAKLPQRPTNRLSELMFNQREYRTRLPVEVASAKVGDLVIEVNAGVEVSGRLVMAAEKKPGRSHGAIVFDDGSAEPISALVNNDATFAAALPIGRYTIRPEFGDVLVTSIRLQDRDVLNEGLVLSEPGNVSLEAIVTRKGGDVAGIVLDDENQPVADATVVLVPEAGLRRRADLFRHCATDQNGRFQIRLVAPGDYGLFAWDGVTEDLWEDPEFLKRYEAAGHDIAVKEGGQAVAEVRLIPAAKR